MKKSIILGLTAVMIMFAGCKEDFLDTKPTDQLSSSVIFESFDGALAALNGTYRIMYAWGLENQTGHNEFGQKTIDLTMDLMGDDMVVASYGYGWFIDEYAYREHAATESSPHFFWDFYYNLINNSNRILANIDDIAASTEEINYIKGQALAIRAYAHFYLVRLFQHTYVGHESDPGIPVYTEPTREGQNRGTVEEVYTQIETDLTEAINLLGNTMERIHISHIDQSVAQGIMARVKLTKEEWGEAASYANDARQGMSLIASDNYTSDQFNQVSGTEWMWGAQINSEQQTTYASFFSHFDARFITYAYLGLQKLIDTELYNQIPDSDVRKDMWLASQAGPTLPQYNQMKFLSYNPEQFLGDYLFMRVSEMYLIEAEALANDGQYTQAQQVLFELVSNRDPNYTQSTATGQALLDEIYLHRRIELWGEGFRLLDIKRRKQPLDRTGGLHDVALANVMQLPAEDDLMIFQIPEEEIDANDAIEQGDQNP